MLAKIEQLVPPTAEARKYITALQEECPMYQMVWLILGLLHYLAKCILEEEITRRNKACKPEAPCLPVPTVAAIWKAKV